MKAIVAVDENWAIGKDNKLLFRIPDDMKRFRAYTTGNVIVMGRHTLESFPGGRPLPDRVNIVMSRRKDYEVKGAIVVHSTEELKKCLEEYDDREIYLIGGDSVYKELLPCCDEAIVTKVDYAYDADRFFPDPVEMGFEKTWESPLQTDEATGIEYTFQKYERA